jgi:hypothetical protein
VRVEHGGVVDVLALALQDGGDGQLLDVDVGAHQGRELRRQGADAHRLHAVGVDQAGDLDAAAVGQAVDQAVVGHVAVDTLGRASRSPR